MFKSNVSEKDSGVSPVISVILMVAITVTLSGIIYLWVSDFSTTTDSALTYVGYDKVSRNDNWDIEIINVQGSLVSLHSITFMICDSNGILVHERSLFDANPPNFLKDSTTIYPLACNDSGVISSRTGLPVTGQDDFLDYVGIIFLILDNDMDGRLSNGDFIKIYGNIDADDELEITPGDHFKIANNLNTHQYFDCIL